MATLSLFLIPGIETMQEIEKKPVENNTEKTEEGLPYNIEELKVLLAKEQEKAQSYLANWQRAAADLINYKRRAEQEKAEAGNLSTSILISKILPVLDDMERALASTPDEGINQEPLIEGVKNIHRKFSSVLESEGISVIKAAGESFDPFVHEAVMQSDGEPGKVIAELRKGYKFNDRVLRPALVVVGKEKDKIEEKTKD